ncbi:glycine cleavage system protein GcvH [Magnetospira sp. QH-2]|uniref:glycine cleavage system protein GcvH n=1 Tax=Magnetospira sp. (strain QH-2) TaxID=1288970 RepID=UPI0003E81368|nr:glycine cleavage system protein GcvH [Magnetospira sp. QH-2]CCQ72741.1 Glycine cleavage system H-protein [Magnetospira sp. QH-2]
MATIKYTKDHEWIRIEENEGTVGITDYAQEQLGDVVFVDLPAVGAALETGGEAAVVESVKAASEIYAPLSGVVLEINEDLEADPSLVNTSAMDGGWFFRMTIGDTAELDDLLDEADYKGYVEGLG